MLSGGSKTVFFSGPAGPVSPLGIGTVTTGAPGSQAAATISGAAPDQRLNLTVPKGDQGIVGPAPWQSPIAWYAGLACIAPASATAVVFAGETYVCVISHIAGTFAADLAAGRWTKVAAKGADGVAGSNGTNGTNGANGADGRSLLNGSGAPASGTGNNGDFYADTTNNRLYGPKAAGAWPGSYVSLIGPAGTNGTNGAAGINGAAWYSGSAAPGTVAGAVNGDWYLNTATGDLYRLISGTWTLQINLTAASGTIRYDVAQSLTAAQRDQARANVGGAVSSAPSASAGLTSADYERLLFPTGAITLTMPNGSAGWRTETIKNANTATGLVTLAVPAGATLDGVTNGTTILYPYQRARIVQTGATAYVTDWIDRAPIVGTVTLTTGVASADFTLPDGYPRFRLRGSNISLSGSSMNLGLRFGDSGSVRSGASDYYSQRTQSFGATTNGRGQADSYGYLTAGESDASSASRAMLDLVIHAGASGSNPKAMGQTYIYDGTDPQVLLQVGADCTGATSGAMARATLLRLLANTGTINTGSFTLTAEP